MATTPIHGWPLPDDTDPVADGAQAIRDLGNAIDSAAMVGAVVIKSADQTGVSGAATITWDSALVDSDGFFDNANDQFVIPVGMGDNRWYEIKFHVEFQNTSGSNYVIPAVTSARTNATDTSMRIGRAEDDSGGLLARNGSLLLNLDEGDSVRMEATGDASYVLRDDGAFMSIRPA